MSRTGVILVAAVALLGVAGCRTLSKGLTEAVLDGGRAEQWHVRYGSRILYTLDNQTMKDIEFEGSISAGDTTIHYQRGLAEQARCIADRTSDLLDHVQQRTGVTIITKSTLYLLRYDQMPQNFYIHLEVEPNEFPLPLFVQAGEESCEGILVQNRGYPYVFVHELVETSLAADKSEGVVLPDLGWGALGLVVHVSNYTRWFRDGLANYAGYIAYEVLSEGVPDSHRVQYRQAVLHANPFTSLAQVGDKLFSWRQASDMRYDGPYYNAALGLFLLIEDLYGQDAIRTVMDEINKRKAVDGRDLVQIVNEVLGADIRRLAEDFEFPEIGAELERLTPALALNHGLKVQEGLFIQTVEKDGAAAEAGLQEKDAITAVGRTPVADELDFERAVFKARKQPSISLTVERPEVGTLTLGLPLEMPDESGDTRRPPGKRSKPTKKSGIESIDSLTLSTP